MIEQDTIKLLRECDAGVKMGVESIEDVLKWVESEELEKILTECKEKHESLSREIEGELERFRDEGKDPPAFVTAMSTIKTSFKIAMEKSDHTVSDLMTDGCNMGVKSLSKYLNKYKAADEKSKDVAKKLISLEEKLARDIRGYL